MLANVIVLPVEQKDRVAEKSKVDVMIGTVAQWEKEKWEGEKTRKGRICKLWEGRQWEKQVGGGKKRVRNMLQRGDQKNGEVGKMWKMRNQDMVQVTKWEWENKEKENQKVQLDFHCNKIGNGKWKEK